MCSSDLQFVVCQQLSLTGNDQRLYREFCIQFVPENDNASGHGHQDDIKANGNTGPQVNLKHGATQPYALRLVDEASPKVHKEESV